MTRSQTMALRNRDFVTASKMIGEPAWRIIFVEILPNLTTLIGINLVGSIIYAIVAQTTLEYLGFGDPLKVSWGTMLYNAQNSSAIMRFVLDLASGKPSASRESIGQRRSLRRLNSPTS